jgi:PAS domain S-box-containing protein
MKESVTGDPCRPRLQRSIARTVAVNLILITTLLIGVFTVVNYVRERTAKMQALQGRLTAVTKFLASSLAPALWDLNEKEIIQTIKSEMGDKEVYGVTVDDIATRTNISLSRGRDWNIIAEPPSTAAGKSFMSMQEPILHLNKQIGSVHVFISPQFVQISLNQFLLNICMGSLVLIVCQSSILYFSLRRTILLPLALISDYARQVCSRNYVNVITPHTKFTGELQVLKHSIEEMVGVLLASEAKYRTIFENAVEGFFQTTLEGVLLSANPALAAFLGYDSPEELMREGADIGAVYVRPDDRARLIAELAKEERVLGFETQILKKDKSTCWVAISCRMVRDQAGNAQYMEGALLDVSMRKTAEERLKQAYMEMESEVTERTAELKETVAKLEAEVAMRKQTETDMARALEAAETATRAKSDFLANMSHEFRTPLNSIIGFAEMLEDSLYGPLNPKQAEYVGRVLKTSRHLLRLINDILDLSKVEAGKMTLETASLGINAIIDDVILLQLEASAKHGVELSADVGATAGLTIEADERKLKQVLFNLISNAIKFTPEGGKVTVSTAAPIPGSEEMLTIAVTDTGKGIAKEDLGRLFKEFTQLESPYTKKFGGTGLGLALTRKLVLLHGGEIGVESEPGQGSRFFFTLPLSQPHNQNNTAPAASGGRHGEDIDRG